MNHLTKEYDYLLTADESLEALERSLNLVENVLKIEFAVSSGSGALKASKLLDDMSHPSFEKMRHRHFRKAERTEELFRIVKTVYLFLKTAEPQLDDNAKYAFEIDSLLVLFHQAYYVLLPRLKSSIWKDERNELINAFVIFSDRISSIAEKHRILGLVAIAKGLDDDAIEHFMLALEATRVGEHDFMTRLQTVWMHLLDLQYFDMALDILLDAYPRVPRNNIPDINQLIRATFDEQASCLRRRTATRTHTRK